MKMLKSPIARIGVPVIAGLGVAFGFAGKQEMDRKKQQLSDVAEIISDNQECEVYVNGISHRPTRLLISYRGRVLRMIMEGQLADVSTEIAVDKYRPGVLSYKIEPELEVKNETASKPELKTLRDSFSQATKTAIAYGFLIDECYQTSPPELKEELPTAPYKAPPIPAPIPPEPREELPTEPRINVPTPSLKPVRKGLAAQAKTSNEAYDSVLDESGYLVGLIDKGWGRRGFFPDLNCGQVRSRCNNRRLRYDIPSRNLRKSGMTDHLERLKRNNPYFKMVAKGLSEKKQTELIDKGRLVQVADETPAWRLRGVGMGNYSGPKNKEKYALLTTESFAVLEEVTEHFQKKLKSYGLPEGWEGRLIINSLYRPAPLNRKIRGSAKTSAHTLALGIDIDDDRFDFIYTGGAGKDHYLFIDPHELSGPKRKKIHEVMRRALFETMIHFYENSGTVYVNDERSRNHFHISTKVPQ